MPIAPGPSGRYSRIVLGLLVAACLAAILPAPITAGQKLAPCEYQGVERIVAVGDVHGAYDRYLEILRAAGVIDDRRHWVGGKTHFVQLGDIVDRGADSRKVIDFLRDLQGAAKRAGGQVHVLLGNHEVMRILGDLRYVSAGEYEAFVTRDSMETRSQFLGELSPEERASFNGGVPLGFVELRLAYGRNGEYGRWLRGLETVIRVNDVLFVHGGLSPDIAQKGCKAINDTVRRELTGDLDKTRHAPLTSLAASESGPLWYRGLTREGDDFIPKLDEILGAYGAKAIVVGHSVQGEGRIQMRFGGRVFAVDTGMQEAYAKGGRASALEIKDGIFTAIYTDRRDVLHGAR